MHGGQSVHQRRGLGNWLDPLECGLGFGSTGSLFAASDAAALTYSVEGSRNLGETDQSENTIVIDALPAANTI